MKPILAATACFITATVVCAHIANDRTTGSTDENEQPVVAYIQSAFNDSATGEDQPMTYGLIGAAALTAVIAVRRISEQLHS